MSKDGYPMPSPMSCHPSPTSSIDKLQRTSLDKQEAGRSEHDRGPGSEGYAPSDCRGPAGASGDAEGRQGPDGPDAAQAASTGR